MSAKSKEESNIRYHNVVGNRNPKRHVNKPSPVEEKKIQGITLWFDL
jgi:hypothetical protein